MILYLTLALIILFAGYVGIITAKYGVLRSISTSFMVLKWHRKAYWFRIFMFACGLLLIAIAILFGGSYSFLLHISGGGAIATGIAAVYTDKITGIIHYIASGLMLVSGIIFLGFVYSWAPAIIIAMVLVIVYDNKGIMPHPVYWFEVVAFGIVLIGLPLATV